MLVSTVVVGSLGLNLPPFFTKDMNQHTLRENTPIGTVVYTLAGKDPEGSPVTFGIKGKVSETENTQLRSAIVLVFAMP